jgi:hypothetical protein
MKNIKRYNLLLLVFLSLKIYAQNPSLKLFTPKSPNIAGFEKFRDIPVNLSNGSLDLSIPLYDIKVGELTIPISLRYNNNGLKCDEIPSWVGLGWNLFVGGYISYNQKGLNDFDAQGGLFSTGMPLLNKYFSSNLSLIEKRFFFDDIIAGKIDSEYDEYNYSFLNNSGSFHFTSANTLRTHPKADLNIVKNGSGFKIEDDEGNEYYFNSKEYIKRISLESTEPNFSDNSSYYISKIITKNNQIINFSYKTYSLKYTTINHFVSYAAPSAFGVGGPGQSETLTTIDYLLLDEITFPSGYVKFQHSDAIRADLQNIDPNTTTRYLKGIVIYNKETKIKEFQFNLSYFGSSNRLKLDAIFPISDNARLAPWEFDYYTDLSGSYPSYFSKSKDHWGYYNGKISLSPIPKANDYSMIAFFNSGYIPRTSFANRASDFNYAKLGMLKSLKYPSGGKSEFLYEPNKLNAKDYNELSNDPFLQFANEEEYSETIAGSDAMQANTITGSFTIPPGGGNYKFQCYRILSPDPFYENPMIIFSGDDTNSISVNSLNTKVNQCHPTTLQQCTFSDNLNLEAGIYNFVIKGSSYLTNEGTNYTLSAGFSLLGKKNKVIGSIIVGGGRISQVTSQASPVTTPLIKKYIYNDSLKFVSFKNIPRYLSIKNLQQVMTSADGTPMMGCSDLGNITTIHEDSTSPMLGPIIEYGMVTELNDFNTANGRTEKHFYLSDVIGGSSTAPIVLRVKSNWLSGSLKEEKIYDGKNKLIQEISYNYSNDYLSSTLNGIKVEYERFCNGAPEQTSYLINPSPVFSATYRLLSSTSTQIYDNKPISIYENYSYDFSKHLKPLSITTNTSEGSILIRKIKYVLDYFNNNSVFWANDDHSLGIKFLKDKNMNLPIESLLIKQIGGIEYVVGGQLNTYKANQTVLDRVYTLDLDSPMPLATFTISRLNNTGLFGFDPRFTSKIIFYKYDIYGNLLENGIDLPLQDGQKSNRTTYLYSYSSQNLIAEIKNAEYSTIEGVLSKAAIEHFSNLTSPSKFDIDAFLVPLKRALPNAQVTSYAYKPLVGMTSQTDVKEMTTYYDYDAFQRLENVKDQKGNIVKNYRYNYAGSSYPSAALSGSFTKNNCPSGQQGTIVAYSLAAGAYTGFTQAEADAAALAAFQAGGQANANTHGNCVSANFKMSYSLPWNRSFMASFYNSATGAVQYRFISGSGEFSDLPQGTYYVSVNETGYNGIHQIYLDWSMLQGTYASYGPLQLTGQHSLYVQELSFSAPLYYRGTYYESIF